MALIDSKCSSGYMLEIRHGQTYGQVFLLFGGGGVGGEQQDMAGHN